MDITLGQPGVDQLSDIVDVLRGWQHDGAPLQLHPGDLGWFWRFGPEATAGAVRSWSRDGAMLAVGLLDGRDLLRLAIAPDAQGEQDLAQQLVADVVAPERGVLPPGQVYVESPPGAAVHDVLGEHGWGADEPWALLRRDLAEPVEDPGVRIEEIGPEHAHEWCAVHLAAFDGSKLTEELAHRRWHAMAAGSPYADARSLVAYDQDGRGAAAVTVWSAGPGRYGVIEPMGVHGERRGRGFGKAITVAAAGALQEMGSSSVIVCTTSANVGAVATYKAAGLEELAVRHDRRRNPS